MFSVVGLGPDLPEDHLVMSLHVSLDQADVVHELPGVVLEEVGHLGSSAGGGRAPGWGGWTIKDDFLGLGLS